MEFRQHNGSLDFAWTSEALCCPGVSPADGGGDGTVPCTPEPAHQSRVQFVTLCPRITQLPLPLFQTPVNSGTTRHFYSLSGVGAVASPWCLLGGKPGPRAAFGVCRWASLGWEEQLRGFTCSLCSGSGEITAWNWEFSPDCDFVQN